MTWLFPSIVIPAAVYVCISTFAVIRRMPRNGSCLLRGCMALMFGIAGWALTHVLRFVVTGEPVEPAVGLVAMMCAFIMVENPHINERWGMHWHG